MNKLGENRICETCGNEFYVPRRRLRIARFCSLDCRRNGEYIKCKCCGKRFYARRSRIKNGKKYCSKKCAIKGTLPHSGSFKNGYDFRRRLISDEIITKAVFLYNDGYSMRDVAIELNVSNTFISVLFRKKGIKKRKSLSEKEYLKRSKSVSGEKNPAWIDGRSFEPYSLEFNEKLKEKIRKRDNYICQKCGRTQQEELEEFGWRLTVHHIDYVKKNCKELNLITLCKRCNTNVNKDRIDWMHYFQNKMNKINYDNK